MPNIVPSGGADRVAFIGTGLMGEPMALRILEAGLPLCVWNRSAAKTKNLRTQGARVAPSAREAVESADIVITMLADGGSVTAVLSESGVAETMRAGSILVDMSSIPPSVAREHGKQLHARGVHYLDAPVSGGTKGASEGTLAIMVGGAVEHYRLVEPVLKIMGRPTLVGPCGSGQLSKLANQSIVAATIAAVAEALVLAAAGGADPAKVKEALGGGFADSMILKLHGQRMLDRNWLPGGPIQTQVKDLKTILNVASQLGVQLPLSSSVSGLFEAALNMGLGQFDHSALLLEIERRNPGVRVGVQPDLKPIEER